MTTISVLLRIIANNISIMLTKQAFSFFRIEDKGGTLPIIAKVKAGFPSPANDYLEEPIDLYGYLVRNKMATFFARVDGDSMEPILSHGDIIVVDRSLPPQNGDVALCYIDGEFTVKTIEQHTGSVRLIPANPAYPPIEASEDNELIIWGIVTSSIKKLKK